MEPSLLLAFALLAAPPDSPVPEPPPVRPAVVQAVAVRLGLLDPEECRWTLASPGMWAYDLTCLRRRFQDLKDAPPLSDALRLPPRDAADEACGFNQRYQGHLDALMACRSGRYWPLHDVQAEAARLYDVWDAIRDAQAPYYYAYDRRLALKRLRDLLGWEDYYRGDWPPCVPVWRFRSAD